MPSVEPALLVPLTTEPACSDEQHRVRQKVKLEPDEWIKDIGCSRHMTGNKKLFSTYKEIDGGNMETKEGILSSCSNSEENNALIQDKARKSCKSKRPSMVQRMVIGLRYGHGMVFGQGKLGVKVSAKGIDFIACKIRVVVMDTTAPYVINTVNISVSTVVLKNWEEGVNRFAIA
ncbi:hypothetical protein Tco_0790615 [Tanacetum coccineum]